MFSLEDHSKLWNIFCNKLLDREGSEGGRDRKTRHVGIADQKIFAQPESFCAHLQNWLKIKSNHSTSFWTVWKYAGQSGKFPDRLESFRTVLKVFGQTGRFPTNLENIRIALSRRFRTDLEKLEVCYNLDKITEVGRQQSLQKHLIYGIYVAKAVMHFWHICHRNDLRDSSGKFLRVKVCRPESWDFLGLWSGREGGRKGRGGGWAKYIQMQNAKYTSTLCEIFLQ